MVGEPYGRLPRWGLIKMDIIWWVNHMADFHDGASLSNAPDDTQGVKIVTSSHIYVLFL